MSLDEEISVKGLLELSGNDHSFVKELLALFITQTEINFKAVLSYYKAGDTDNLLSSLHKMKSATSPLGLSILRKRLSELELLIKSVELSSLRNEMTAIETLVKAILANTEKQLLQFSKDED